MTLKYDLIMANHAHFHLLTARDAMLFFEKTKYLLYEQLRAVSHTCIFPCNVECGCYPSIPFPFWVELHSHIFQVLCRWQFACLHQDKKP